MGPGELVDGAGVAREGGVGGVAVAGDVIDFNGAVFVLFWVWTRDIILFETRPVKVN